MLRKSEVFNIFIGILFKHTEHFMHKRLAEIENRLWFFSTYILKEQSMFQSFCYILMTSDNELVSWEKLFFFVNHLLIISCSLLYQVIQYNVIQSQIDINYSQSQPLVCVSCCKLLLSSFYFSGF